MRIKIYIFIVLTIIIGFGPLFCKDNNDMSDTMIKNDYYEKERVILGINEAFLNHLYKDRININAYKEFNKVGIDLKELPYKLAGGTDFRENALTSDLVIIGRVLKIEYDKTQQDLSKNIYYAYYGSTYTIQVEEVLLGKDLYPKPPEQVFIKRRSGLYSSVSFETVHLEIGKQYIFFLTRHPLKLLKENLHSLSADEIRNFMLPRTYPGDEVFDNKFIFEEYTYSTLYIKSAFVYSRFGRIEPSLDLVKKIIRQIEKINDRRNFYNRDYKIKKEEM